MAYSEEDITVASGIISSYFERAPSSYFERQAGPEVYSERGEVLALFDVETNVEQFSAELELAQRFGVPMPCMPLGINGDRLAPVSFEFAFGFSPFLRDGLRTGLGRGLGINWFEDTILRYGSPRYFEQPGSYVAVSADTARNSFISLATEFVATRIASGRSDGEHPSSGDASNTGDEPILQLSRTGAGPPTRTPGCRFVVTTNSPGLRVHWSGAFRITPNYFSSPTSPVSSILQSGTFIFGVDGGAYSSIQWDTTAIVSLPGSPQLHLNY